MRSVMPSVVAAVCLSCTALAAQEATSNPARAAAQKERMGSLKPISTGDGGYVGEIRAFAGESCPDNWLPADGRSLNVGNPNADLFSVISDYWGSTAANSFQLPDLRGVVLRGWNQGRGDKWADPDVASRELMPGAPGYPTGDKNHVGTFQADQFQTHRHNDSGHTHAIQGFGYHDSFGCGPHCGALTGGGTLTSTSSSANVTDPASLTAEEVRHGRESRSKNAYVLYCIRNGKR